MTRSVTVELLIEQVIPNAGEKETGAIIQAWEEAGNVLRNRPFRVEDPFRAEPDNYEVTLDLSGMLTCLRQAQTHSGSFARYLQNACREVLPSDARLGIEIVSQDSPLEQYTLHHAVGVFVHQLMLALTIAMPGSCHMTGTRYAGDQTRTFEAPEFDSAMFGNAWLSAFDAQWPVLAPLKFETVWQWLQSQGASETDTAIKPVSKVLFGLLEVALHRQYFGSRDVLMVSHMLEMLMAMEEDANPNRLRERIAVVLGTPTAKAGSFTELYRVKKAMIQGEHPVKRPPIVIHDADEAILKQLEQHNSPVEQALAIVLALLQDLACNQSSGYRFSEQVTRLS
jgi:hypothetical protein